MKRRSFLKFISAIIPAAWTPIVPKADPKEAVHLGTRDNDNTKVYSGNGCPHLTPDTGLAIYVDMSSNPPGNVYYWHNGQWC